MPLNIEDRQTLSRDVSHCGLSYFDVPERTLREAFVARVSQSRILIQPDAWGDPFYAIIDRDGQVVPVRGTAYEPRLHRHLVSKQQTAPRRHVREGVWILELWDHNYAHWVLWHLPKLQMIRRLRLGTPVLVPATSPILPVVHRSLELLGFTASDVIPVDPGVLHVDSLTVFGMDDYDPSLLRDLRAALGVPAEGSGRRVFVSRRRAARRRVVNEAEVWRILEPLGYECVTMEDLSFDEQIRLMNGVVALVSSHGAGLANLLFVPSGAHVVELSSFPSPMFYAAAAAVGHNYWLVNATPIGAPSAGYGADVLVDLSMLHSVATRVERALTSGA